MLRQVILLFVSIGFLEKSAAQAGEAFSPEQRKEIQKIVKENIDHAVKQAVLSRTKEEVSKLVKESFTKGLKHIQEGLGVAFALASESVEKENRQEEALEIHKDKIFENHRNHPFLGASQAKKIAIIFTDPYCSHCHQSFDDFEKHLQKAPAVRLIIYNYPLFGKDSRVATEAMLAAHLQKKYIPFYKAFRKKISQKPKALSVDDLVLIAKATGLNVNQFRQDLKNPAINQMLKEVILVGKDFNVTGTPTFILQGVSGGKGRVIEGAMKPDDFFVNTASAPN